MNLLRFKAEWRSDGGPGAIGLTPGVVGWNPGNHQSEAQEAGR